MLCATVRDMETGVSPNLEAVLARHGARCEIGQDTHNGMWVSVERPSETALVIHARWTLAELAAVLDAEVAP